MNAMEDMKYWLYNGLHVEEDFSGKGEDSIHTLEL